MRYTTIALAGAVLGLALSRGALAEPAGPAVTAAIPGDYALVYLTLEKGGPVLEKSAAADQDLPLVLGLREGRVVCAWFSHPALSRTRVMFLDRSDVALAGDALRGELIGRTALNWGDKNVHDYVYRLDGRREGGKLSGVFTASFTDDREVKRELSGKLSGRIVSGEEARTANRLPDGANWAHYFGATQAFSAPVSPASLVDDLAKARPLWRSEAVIPTSYGSAPDARYYDRAGRTDVGGGSSSPIVYEGKVYQFYYRPTGPVGLDKAYLKYETEAQVAAKARELFPKRPQQQRAVVDFFRTQADEIVVCLDASTGQTLWKTTLPKRGANYQTHKHRGHFPVPLAAGGVLYQPGTTGRLYALDAATGRLLWEYPDAQPEAFVTRQAGIQCGAPSPVRLGDLVIYSAGKGLVALDAKSGVKRWEKPLSAASALVPYTGQGQSLVIALDRSHEKQQNYLVALQAADGKVLWREPTSMLADYTFPILAGDLLLGYSLLKENIKPGENDGLAVIHAYRTSVKGLQTAWTTPPLGPIIDTVGMAASDKHLYVSTAAAVHCLNLGDGSIATKAEGVGGARTQTAFLSSGRLFIQPEGRHGSQSFFMLTADPGSLRILGESRSGGAAGHPVAADRQWYPPHSTTTAYANQPLVYPLVDGRLFVRGLDGIYCYDLRKQP